MTEPTDTTISPEDFGDAFDDWLKGATLGQTSVDIYANPALFAEYEKLERELKVAEAIEKEAAADDEEAMDALPDETAAGKIHARMAEIYRAWKASKSTWTVRGIPKPDARELGEEYPALPLPDDLPADANAVQQSAHKALVAEYDQRSDDRNYAILERVVVKIEFADGRVRAAEFDDDGLTIVTPAVTVAQLAAMRERLGEAQYLKLIAASKRALKNEPVIPAPFLRSNSKSERT